MSIEIKQVDRDFYAQRLAGFLPSRIIDIHTHIWDRAHQISTASDPRLVQWTDEVARFNSLAELQADYHALLPGVEVVPLLFGQPLRSIDLDANNQWVSQAARAAGFPALYIPVPEMSPERLEEQVIKGGFCGLKPYLSLAPAQLNGDQVTIFDFLPLEHLAVAEAHNWLVMLHIPRPGRLKDPLNLHQMLEIEKSFPHVKLIIAHMGRAYCDEDLGDALKTLRKTERMVFDFSANTNSRVMTELIRAVGAGRVLFGSDMPITRMRLRRICENGFYVNMVPPGVYSGETLRDAHIRELPYEEGEQLSFFMYEELDAFRRACEATGLSRGEIEMVFYRNAARLLGFKG